MILTQEQIDGMVALSAPLVAAPLPWTDLSPEQQGAFQLLMPDPSFDDIQRFYLGLWVLSVTSQQVDDLNALMPPGSVIEPRVAENSLFVNADLLSDALDGRRLAALLPVLETLPLTYAETVTWPVEVEVEP